MKKKVLSVLLCAALVAGMVVGCGSKKEEAAPAAEEKKEEAAEEAAEEEAPAEEAAAEGSYFKCGVAIKTQDGPYFVALVDGVKKYCAEAGLVEKEDDVVVLNANMDVAAQTANFETFVTQDYDVIFCDCIDPDNVIADIKNAMAAGIPVIDIDSGINEHVDVTTVYSNNKQNGRMSGIAYAKTLADDQEIVGIMLSGEKGNVAGNERRQGLICGILETRLGISEEEAWELTAKADEELLGKGSYKNEDAKFEIAGQGWGNWTVNDILADAEDLVTKTKGRLTTMFGENDQMLFGGMQAAESAGLTDIAYVAAADGAKEAYDYIKGDKTTTSGQYIVSGENSPALVGKLAVEIAKEILVDGKDMNSYEAVTMTEAVAVTKDNVDERYEFGF